MIIGEDAQKKMLNGINIAADILAPTLGPSPRLVIIDDGTETPLLLDDGVNISKHIKVADPYEMVGVKLVRMVAHEAQKASGDGTTTSTVVARALLNSLFDEMKENGTHPSVLAASLDDAWELFKDLLFHESWKADDEQLLEVAMSCTNYDELSANAVHEAFQAVGADGVVMAHQHMGELTHVEINEGLTLNKGFISHLLVGSRDGTAKLDNPLVLITDHTIESFDEMLPYLEAANAQRRPLIFISAGMKPHAAQNFILNVVQGKIQGCAINPIATGEERAEIYEDLAIMLGGSPILAARGQRLGEAEFEFGEADTVVIDRHSTVFSGTRGDADKIKERVEDLTALVESADHPFYADKYSMRRSKLQGQIATIRIGGLTDAEVRERHERIDDAINAVRSALKGGVVVGGGMTLALAETGFTPLDIGLKSVLHQLVKGFDISLSEERPEWKWFDAKTGKFSNDANPLVDSHDVLYNSVKAAVSVAMMVLKSGSVLLSSESL